MVDIPLSQTDRSNQWLSIPIVAAVNRTRKPVLLENGGVLAPTPSLLMGDAPVSFAFLSFVSCLLGIHTATKDPNFSKDVEHVQRFGIKSVLCIPLVRKGHTVAVMYMENNSTPGAFSPERVSPLQLIMSQVAISVDNAYLYRNMSLLNTAYERFLPKAFLRELGVKSVVDVRLGQCLTKQLTVRGPCRSLEETCTHYCPLLEIDEILSPHRSCLWTFEGSPKSQKR